MDTISRHSITLYPFHRQGIDKAAALLGIRNNSYYFSPALQFIIEDWLRKSSRNEKNELRQIVSELPIGEGHESS